MRILLVKPKPALHTIRALQPIVRLEPLELGYVAAAVPPGHQVEVLDLRLSRWADRAFAKKLRLYQPDLVGLSGYTHEVEKVKKLARTIRRLRPEARVVVGGHHATVLPKDYNLDCFDGIVRGEGCAPFRAVVEALQQGTSLVRIANVLVPGANFDHKAASRMPRYPDLSSVPSPRRDLWDSRRYRCIWPVEQHPPGHPVFPEVALVRSSFGCLLDCSFCVVPALSGRRHLVRPPEQVADEIASLPQRHIYFCDDETFLNEAHARRLAEAIRHRGIEKRFFAWARSTTVNRHPDLFRLWREIGLDGAFLGFEAIEDEQLEQISKHSTVADNERAHAILRKLGIAVHAGFMVNAGFTRQAFHRLRDYIKRMPPAQITCTVYSPSPGSEAWHADKDRYVGHASKLHDCMHPLTSTVIPLREFFEEFSKLNSAGSSRHPLRTQRALIPFRDILVLTWATARYARALRRGWRDY